MSHIRENIIAISSIIFFVDCKYFMLGNKGMIKGSCFL